MELMRDILLAYIAGILDGEGCIIISNSRRRITLRVSVANTDICLMKLLSKNFGGSIQHRKPYKPTWKPGYEWVVCADKASKFLKLVSPFLQLKMQQAEIAIRFQGRRGIQGKHATEEQKTLDRNDSIAMHKLNLKGIIEE